MDDTETLTQEYKRRGRELFGDYLTKLSALYLGGMTLEQIGAREGITRERVRQLLLKKEINGTHSPRRHKLSISARLAQQRVESREKRFQKHFGCSYSEALAAVGCSNLHMFSEKQNGILRLWWSHKRHAQREFVGWEISLTDYAAIIGDRAKQFRLKRDGLVLTRRDRSLPYTKDNIEVLTLAELSKKTNGFARAHDRHSRLRLERAKKALEMYDSGQTIPQISESLKKSAMTISCYLDLARRFR